jgi:alkylation response protein AidB-like acyl-CoA dehydrogenase
MSKTSVMSSTLERVAELTPEISARGEEIERARRVPADLLAKLVAAGWFRMLLPRAYGGDDLSLSEALTVVETLAEADAATGWTVMIGAATPLVLGFLPRATFDEIYAAGPDVIGGGALAPKGQAVPVEGGYRVTGQWPFVSGCEHSAWLALQCVQITDGQPQLQPNGMPVMRVTLFPAGQAEILDTWQVAGLRGTGSHDVRLQEVFCPKARTCTLFGAAPTITGGGFLISPVAQLGLYVGAVAVGIAAGAVNDLACLAGSGKRPAFAPRRLAEAPLFQERLGEADGALRSARALLHAEAVGAWDRATRGAALGLLDRARLRATGHQVTRLAALAVDTAYTAGGGTSLYDSSPLQRRLRDLHALTQHAAVGADFVPLVGALLAGEPVDAMRL